MSKPLEHSTKDPPENTHKPTVFIFMLVFVYSYSYILIHSTTRKVLKRNGHKFTGSGQRK